MRQLNAEFPTGDLSFNEYDVLLNLSREDGRRVRIKDLNRHLLLTQPSVSRLIDRLASRDIITKVVDPSDGRGVIVQMTELGFALFRRVAATHIDSIVSAMGSALDTDELIHLTVLTDKVRAAEPAQSRATERARVDADTGDHR